jgi:hypothetical protein
LARTSIDEPFLPNLRIVPLDELAQAGAPMSGMWMYPLAARQSAQHASGSRAPCRDTRGQLSLVIGRYATCRVCVTLRVAQSVSVTDDPPSRAASDRDRRFLRDPSPSMAST